MPNDRYNPAYDNKIYQKYAQKTIENKMKNKEALCEALGLTFNKKVAIIGITYALKDENNVGMIQDIMNGILEQPVQIILTSIGTAKYQQYFTHLSEEHPDQIVITDNNEEEKRKIYAGSDIILIPTMSEECKEEAARAMKYGVIPIMPPVEFGENYNPNTEQGNAFIYMQDSPWNFFATLIRALESFKFPYDWKNIQKRAMSAD